MDKNALNKLKNNHVLLRMTLFVVPSVFRNNIIIQGSKNSRIMSRIIQSKQQYLMPEYFFPFLPYICIYFFCWLCCTPELNGGKLTAFIHLLSAISETPNITLVKK